MNPTTPSTRLQSVDLLRRGRKYPASTWYLLMTLGPAIALIPYAEKARGWLARMLTPIGRVPLFYYLLHIPLIHGSALLVNFIRYETESRHRTLYYGAQKAFQNHQHAPAA